MAQCFQCEMSFCKYGVFGDPEQGIGLHYHGPHGQTPLIEACLIANTDVFNLEPLVCEIGNCVGNHVIFCSIECKEEHSPMCSGCKERTHTCVEVDSEIFCKECGEYQLSIA
jgi:hypothetical protein